LFLQIKEAEASVLEPYAGRSGFANHGQRVVEGQRLLQTTSDILLGTSIVGIWGHDAQTTRMAAQTLHEATGGRFVLGLGVSHPHLAEKLRGHAYDRPLTRMREYLAAYRAAIYRGPVAEGVDGPPILIAALRERMLALAATDADGAFPYLVTPERVAWMRGVLDAANRDRRPILAVSMPAVLETDATAAREAARAYLGPYLRTPAYQACWAEQGFEASDWEKPGRPADPSCPPAATTRGDHPLSRSRRPSQTDRPQDR